ncbi:MAG: hypothetical protein ABI164_04985 [Acidobacteriaceae bacterium]
MKHYLTDNLPAAIVYALYKSRRQVPGLLKWIKQHLRIDVFSGTGDYAVKIQIRITVLIYLLLAIARKRLHCQAHSTLCAGYS